MKIRLLDLPLEQTIEFGADFVRSAIDGMPMRDALGRSADDSNAGSGRANLSLYLERENVFVNGRLTGSIEVACGRCLGPVRVAIDEPLAVSYLPKEGLPSDDTTGTDEEVELTAEDDVDVYPYEGESIDLAPLFRERLILAIPYAPLCREECKGLCSTCGIDLNTGKCQCERDSVDPRLAALKDFKL